jgi:predicted nucleic-acid-binding protein
MTQYNGSLDTNILLRLITLDIPEQHEAVVKLLHKPNAKFFVGDVAFIETAFVLSRNYEMPREAIKDTFSAILQHDELQCNGEIIYAAMDYFVAHPALSFEDCCLAVYARVNQAEPLYTFDHKLANQLPEAKLLT